jgi:hypothetical protein
LSHGYVNECLAYYCISPQTAKECHYTVEAPPIDSVNLDSTDMQLILSTLIRGLTNAATMPYQKED